jgi:hypothetical protein
MHIFRPGQLVRLSALHSDDLAVELYSFPPGAALADDGDSRVVGRLDHADVALVIALGNRDGSKLYVFGPHGGGWTFGAFFEIEVEA